MKLLYVKLLYVKLLYVKFCMVSVREAAGGGGGTRRRHPGYRIKNKNPTQRCGEKTLYDSIQNSKSYPFEAIE